MRRIIPQRTILRQPDRHGLFILWERKMNGEIQQTHNMYCITSVTPTICKLMGIKPPAVSDQNCLDHVIQATRCNGVENVEKCLVFAPDAIGIQMFLDYRQVFATVLEHAPIKCF